LSHEFWYISRAAGFTSYLLLFVSVVLGIANGTRFAERFFRRNSVFDLHRFTALLALVFALLHVYILLGDGYFNINIVQLSVPFLSPYRPWQVAAGIFSLYSLVLVIASFYVRKYIGFRAWRTLHFITFAMFGGVTVHGIMAGTDTNEPWAKAIYIACGAAVMVLIFYRVQYRMPDTSGVRAMRLGSAIATCVAALVLLLGTGLFSASRPSSAAVSGFADTATSDASAPVSTASEPYPFLDSFDDDFNGTFVQSRDASGAHLTLDGTAAGDLNAKLHIELAQQAVAGSRRANITVNTAELRDSATNAPICSGQLTQLDDGFVRVTCLGSGPYAGVEMTLSSRIEGNQDGTFSGALSGSMQRGG
jgi:sulfoxide reductase heme-binding subunit YedZ